MAHMMTVHRKAYTVCRKKHSHSKTCYHVPATTFREKAKPHSLRARGKKPLKVIPKLKKGSLGVKFSDSKNKRRARESKLARRIGERKVVSKLRAIAVLEKNTNPAVSEKAAADAHYIAGSFEGKQPVRYPQGFRGTAKSKLRSIS